LFSSDEDEGSESDEYDIFIHGKKLERIEDINKRYKVGAILGMGGFGVVRTATMNQTNFPCAVKIIKKKIFQGHRKLYQ